MTSSSFSSLEKLAKTERPRPRISQIREHYLQQQQTSSSTSSSLPDLPPKLHRQPSAAASTFAALTARSNSRSNSRSTRGAVLKAWKEAERLQKENNKLCEEISQLEDDLSKKDQSYSRRLDSSREQLTFLQHKLDKVSRPMSSSSKLNKMDRHRELVTRIHSTAECLESAIKMAVNDEVNVLKRSYSHRINSGKKELDSVLNRPPNEELEHFSKVLETARGEGGFLEDQLTDLFQCNEDLALRNSELVRDLEELKIKRSVVIEELTREKHENEYLQSLLSEVVQTSRTNRSSHSLKVPKLDLSYDSLMSRAQESAEFKNLTVNSGQSARLLQSLNTQQLENLTSRSVNGPDSFRKLKKRNEMFMTTVEKQAVRLTDLLKSKKKILSGIRRKHVKAAKGISDLESALRKTLSNIRDGEQSNVIDLDKMPSKERLEIVSMAFFTEEILTLLNNKDS
ncbi:hypothetical protein GEMRC1_005965 [Eukaryota sp. GEM-RC1]